MSETASPPGERNADGGDGEASPAPRRSLSLALGALGVVYGDIGTSPLYALRECFHGPAAVPITPENVVGILSLILWSLIAVVSIKYLVFVMRADNRGEGGILALLTLVAPTRDVRGLRPAIVLLLGLVGSAFLYGDGMITPAISVLSAVEGLGIITPGLTPYVLPIAVVILGALFAIQRRGTAAVGALFGPVMVAWFGCLAVLGIRWIIQAPEVLAAIDPGRAVRFLGTAGWTGFLVLSAVFLVVTGGEALYADMGHFGRRPIQRVWFAFVLPALALNYFGQGALLLQDPAAAANPFFHMASPKMLPVLVALATAATVIASQAVISGAFSLTNQALQLGYCPRIEVLHTSSREIGQVYVPAVNWLLMVSAAALVLSFGESSALAGAYGVAVSSTMIITTILAFLFTRRRWGWSLWAALTVAAAFLIVDSAFFIANMTKIEDGGWVPLLAAGVVALFMTTWYRGRFLLARELRQDRADVDSFLHDIEKHPPMRPPGLAVFMDSNPTGIPRTLLHNLKHNRVLHERVVLLTVATEEIPRVPTEERMTVNALAPGFIRVVARYGYMERPNVPALLRQARDQGLWYEPMLTTFFLSRETLICTTRPGMGRWRKRLFALMLRNALRATAHYGIPPNRVVELGAEVTI
jgi:KUP system potassium uptake protein